MDYTKLIGETIVICEAGKRPYVAKIVSTSQHRCHVVVSDGAPKVGVRKADTDFILDIKQLNRAKKFYFDINLLQAKQDHFLDENAINR